MALRLGARALAAVLLFAANVHAQKGPLRYERHVLDNGLTVILREDHAVPVVVAHMWYKVGSKNEEPGRTGFAHFYEHYMFEGSAHVPPGGYDAATTGRGGINNASTSQDATIYYAEVPAENLEETLRVESDRLCCLREALNQEKFDKQRSIVKNEKRRRENQPYGRVFDEVLKFVWTDEKHPYHHSVIGSEADLDKATLEDVSRFHASYYVPGNAVLTISGDHDSRETLALVKKYYGPIPAGAKPPQAVVPASRSLGARREKTMTDDKAQLPLLIMAFPVPGEKHPDNLALSVLGFILGSGRSARLVRELEHNQELAMEVGAGVVDLDDSDLFIISALAMPEVSLKDLEAAIWAEVDRLVKDGIAEREMARIKASLNTMRLNLLQNAHAMADVLSSGEVLARDPGLFDKQIASLADMSPEAPRLMARKYLGRDNVVVFIVVPGGEDKP